MGLRVSVAWSTILICGPGCAHVSPPDAWASGRETRATYRDHLLAVSAATDLSLQACLVAVYARLAALQSALEPPTFVFAQDVYTASAEEHYG
jgi:hypothetical protein